MARPPRCLEYEGPHHLTARGSNRQVIFRDDADYQSFVARLAATGEARQWSCLAYCLMPNHVHLIVQAQPGAISAGMGALLGGHAQRFNHRHERSGHLFGERFHHVPILNDDQIHTALRYIALNPVRAGLVHEPTDWPWSSHSALASQLIYPGALDVRALTQVVGAPDNDLTATRRALLKLVSETPATPGNAA